MAFTSKLLAKADLLGLSPLVHARRRFELEAARNPPRPAPEQKSFSVYSSYTLPPRLKKFHHYLGLVERRMARHARMGETESLISTLDEVRAVSRRFSDSKSDYLHLLVDRLTHPSLRLARALAAHPDAPMLKSRIFAEEARALITDNRVGKQAESIFRCYAQAVEACPKSEVGYQMYLMRKAIQWGQRSQFQSDRRASAKLGEALKILRQLTNGQAVIGRQELKARIEAQKKVGLEFDAKRKPVLYVPNFDEHEHVMLPLG